MLHRADSWHAARRDFRWRIPTRYNIGVDICDRHAARRPGADALLVPSPGGLRRYSFRDLALSSNRFANLLVGRGLSRGDRFAILLPQCVETALAHIAAYKAGLIAVPLFTLFGEDALEYRLHASGAKAVVCSSPDLAKIAAIRERLPDLRVVLSIDGPGDGAEDLQEDLSRASDGFDAVDTAPNDPALLIFTSGTTGPPKGALHAHRTLLGHLPGVEFMHDFFPARGDRFWTPADWAWIGGLIDVLLPSLHHAVPVVVHRAAKFDPEEAFRLMADCGVRNAFLPPTALKMMRQVRNPRRLGRYSLRSVFSGGETLGAELLDWGREAFGLTVNEGYGQTECNLVVGNNAAVMPVRPGSMGRAVPGHTVAIVDAEGRQVPAGDVGTIAVRQPDPVAFLGYWQDEAATRAKYAGDWLMTGDIGTCDEEGYFRFIGRDDDVITSGGYRIGPGEVEDCLSAHPAVAMAAVVGVPDPLRTQAVKAFVVLRDGVSPSDALAREIQDHVKRRLAAHEYPRAVEFVTALPMTATGKVVRRALRESPSG